MNLGRYRTRINNAVMAIINARDHFGDEYQAAESVFIESGLPYGIAEIHRAFDLADKRGGLT